ncbi:MAG TPA: oxidoreductase [Kiloniellales bacterium]|jgi:NAD(P)-dependent dehydrogenase (short-subunit alcohol dehydrogenase family)
MPDRAQEAVISALSIMNSGPAANAVRCIVGLGAIFTILALRDQAAPPTLNLSAPIPPGAAADKRPRHFETQSSTKKEVISMNKTNPGVALVTGASSGIGYATAKALQSAGFRVFGTSRRAVAQRSDGVTMLTCDVTDDASVAKLVDDVLAEAGRIDLLVNNAGIGLLGGAEESSTAQAQALFDVNVFGVLRVTNAVLPTMRRQGKGRIVNLSSVLGFIPAPYSALYSSTKHAVEGYSESLDHELRPFGIRVALVEPAYTRTSFEENLAKPDQLLDVYDSARAGISVTLRKALETGDAPEVVARTVLKAATDSVPKRRYAAGKMARQVSFLRRFVPASAFDKSLRKQNGLPV